MVRNRVGPNAFTIRATSKRLKNKYVGTDILAAILPARAALTECVAAIGPQGKVGVFFDNDPPNVDTTTSYDECPLFFRFHPGRDNAVYHAPHIVATGFKNFRVWAPEGFEFDLEGRIMKDNGGQIIALAGAEVRRKGTRRR